MFRIKNCPFLNLFNLRIKLFICFGCGFAALRFPWCNSFMDSLTPEMRSWNMSLIRGTDPDRLVQLRADARLEEAEINALLHPEITGLIDINTASVEMLKSIKGVGEVTAQRIITLRPFSDPKDLDRIPRLPAATRSNILARTLWE